MFIPEAIDQKGNCFTHTKSVNAELRISIYYIAAGLNPSCVLKQIPARFLYAVVFDCPGSSGQKKEFITSNPSSTRRRPKERVWYSVPIWERTLRDDIDRWVTKAAGDTRIQIGTVANVSRISDTLVAFSERDGEMVWIRKNSYIISRHSIQAIQV